MGFFIGFSFQLEYVLSNLLAFLIVEMRLLIEWTYKMQNIALALVLKYACLIFFK